MGAALPDEQLVIHIIRQRRADPPPTTAPTAAAAGSGGGSGGSGGGGGGGQVDAEAPWLMGLSCPCAVAVGDVIVQVPLLKVFGDHVGTRQGAGWG